MLKREDLIAVLADTLATDFFVEMLNPKNRGPNFRFSLFDIERWVGSRLGLNLPRPPTAKELKQASSRARKKWSQLIAQVGDGISQSSR
jgi:hypothetical protein